MMEIFNICDNKWWVHLLYLNNFYPDDLSMVSASFSQYIISLLIV